MDFLPSGAERQPGVIWTLLSNLVWYFLTTRANLRSLEPSHLIRPALMFHSAECQIQCPITRQIEAKGPPPPPLSLIMEEVPPSTSRRKRRVCQTKARDTRTYTHTHTRARARIHIRGSIPGARESGGSLTQSLSVAAHTQRPQCSSLTALQNSRSRMLKSLKLFGALYTCDVMLIVSRSRLPHTFTQFCKCFEGLWCIYHLDVTQMLKEKGVRYGGQMRVANVFPAR